MRQGCQMVSFRAKNSNLGKFWRYLDGKTDTYFMAIWNILRAFGIFYVHLEKKSGFGIMYKEKSGNPGMRCRRLLHSGNVFACHQGD
jgi:hypothetical protein